MKVLSKLFYFLLLFSAILVPSLLSASSVVENADNLCYEDMKMDGWMCGDIGPCAGGIGCKKTYPVRNISNESLSNVVVDYDETGMGGSFGSSCGVDEGGTCSTKSDVDFGPVGILGKTTEFKPTDSIAAGDADNIWVKNLVGMSCFNGENLYATYTKNGKNYRGKMKPCPVSYCEENGLSEGFHVIDPDGGDEDNSFEIFCHEENNIWHDLLALPIKNSSNNFLFDDSDTSLNYYNETENPRTHFQAVEIDGGHITYNGTQPNIPVIKARSDEPWNITTDGHAYKVMGANFSNINLIGTPFKIDWDNTTLTDSCDESKLRKALGQAVKYNTLTNDGKSRCEISDMSLTLLDDYRFLVYDKDGDGDKEEILQHSCKEMANYIPNNTGVLNDADVDGHFNILTSEPTYSDTVPTTNGTRANSQDIGDAKSRPLTVYCKYQTDLNYVWTFLTALDGVVTNSKNDITNKRDTCSQLGLWFFVPNSKETFNRVRLYLKDQKDGDNGWINYTGTVREKYKMYTNDPDKEYYINKIGYEKIWPYGPFGIYYPTNGWQSGDNSWYGGSGDVRGWMSGSPMHNITSMTNYNDSMGKKGFVSILGDQDLNKTNSWWVADIGAGEEVGNSTPEYSPHGNHIIQSEGYIYYEPNGNYTANAWLNFVHDDEGWVYHNDDNNAFYAYYDYMCMSETNYDSASRYSLIPGFFNAIERGTRVGNTNPNFVDTNITTKIVSKPISLDLISYGMTSTGQIDRSYLSDQNKSVGVFVSNVEDSHVTPINFLGTYQDFSNHGRIEMDDFNISTARKQLIVQFYYCKTPDRNWEECWDYTTSNGIISLTSKDNNDSAYSDSIDDFSARPKEFKLSSVVGNIIKAKDINISYKANNYLDNPTNNYDEAFSNLNVVATLADSSKLSNCPASSSSLILPSQFINGVENNSTTFGNVGLYTLKIEEISGLEFAAIDSDDTPDNDRFISPDEMNLTIVPDHFTVSVVPNINHHKIDMNFTYISDDKFLDNMALKFDFNTTAQNNQGGTTTNYTNGCYANNIDVDLNYNSTLTPHAKVFQTSQEANGSSNIIPFVNLPSSHFTTDHNGTAEIKLRINFGRNKTTPINPFTITFNDLNVSDKNTTLYVGTNNHIINLNGTIIYGRTHATRHRFRDNSNSPQDHNVSIYYETYCYGAGCDKTLLPDGSSSERTDDIRWFRNTKHSVSNDGNAGNVNEKTNHPAISVISQPNNANPSVTILKYGGSYGYPYRTTMENNASDWLIYNPDNSSATKNEFSVEFDNSNTSWGGEYNTTTTTKNRGTATTNRRSMW